MLLFISLEAIATRLEAIAIMLGFIAFRGVKSWTTHGSNCMLSCCCFDRLSFLQAHWQQNGEFKDCSALED